MKKKGIWPQRQLHLYMERKFSYLYFQWILENFERHSINFVNFDIPCGLCFDGDYCCVCIFESMFVLGRILNALK